MTPRRCCAVSLLLMLSAASAASAQLGDPPARDEAGYPTTTREAGASPGIQITPSATVLRDLALGLGDERASLRRAALVQLLALGHESLPAIRTRLAALAEQRVEPRALAQRLSVLRRQRRPRPHDGSVTETLAAALAADRSAPMRQAVELVALQEALVTQRTRAAADALVDGLWRVSPTALRGEAARVRRELGALLAPAYLRHASQAADPALRRLGRAALAALAMSTPAEAFARSEPEVTSALIDAYAALRSDEALPFIVGYLGDARPTLHKAAQRASASFGERATPLLRERYLRLSQQPAPESWTAPRLLHEIALIQHAPSEAAAATAITAAEAALAANQLAEAQRSLDLAPHTETHAERIARAYLAVGDRHLSAHNPRAALRAYRRALRQAPPASLATSARARVLQLEAELRMPSAIADVHALARATTLDPSLTRARELLDTLRGVRAADRLAMRRRLGLVAAALLAVAAALLVRDARQRRRHPRA